MIVGIGQGDNPIIQGVNLLFATMVVLGSAIGITSGFYGGKFDVVMQRFIDMFGAFPFLVALITIFRLLPPPSRISLGPVHIKGTWPTVNYLAVVLGALLSINSSRVLRSVALSIREESYIAAARTIGASDFRIIVRHLIPNTLPTTIVLATGLFGAAIFIEAAVSFVGVGLPPSVPSWGRQLNEATASIRQSVNSSIWPGVAIALVVWGRTCSETRYAMSWTRDCETAAKVNASTNLHGEPDTSQNYPA